MIIFLFLYHIFVKNLDYPFGQHRWVEYADIHNFDATNIQPE